MIKFDVRSSPGSVHSDFCPPFSDYVDVLALAANTAGSLTVPDTSPPVSRVFISCDVAGAMLWVKLNGTAAIPSGSVTNGSASCLNVSGRKVKAGDTISCICSDACNVVAEYFN